VAKVQEELDEVKVEIAANDKAKLEEELGDLLFVVVNLVRHSGFKAEDTLRKANLKFERRFRGIEDVVAQQGKTLSDCSLEELDAIWDDIKKQAK
jgi:ATP diphosphatase